MYSWVRSQFLHRVFFAALRQGMHAEFKMHPPRVLWADLKVIRGHGHGDQQIRSLLPATIRRTHPQAEITVLTHRPYIYSERQVELRGGNPQALGRLQMERARRIRALEAQGFPALYQRIGERDWSKSIPEALYSQLDHAMGEDEFVRFNALLQEKTYDVVVVYHDFLYLRAPVAGFPWRHATAKHRKTLFLQSQGLQLDRLSYGGKDLVIGRYPAVPTNAYTWTYYLAHILSLPRQIIYPEFYIDPEAEGFTRARILLQKSGIGMKGAGRLRPCIALSGIVGGTDAVNHSGREKGFSRMETLAVLTREILRRRDADLIFNPTERFTPARIAEFKRVLVTFLPTEQWPRVHFIRPEEVTHPGFMKNIIYLSDLVLTVEGGFGHTAICLGTPLLSLQSQSLESEISGYDVWMPDFLPAAAFRALKFAPHFDDLTHDDLQRIAGEAAAMI